MGERGRLLKMNWLQQWINLPGNEERRIQARLSAQQRLVEKDHRDGNKPNGQERLPLTHICIQGKIHKDRSLWKNG